MLPTILVTGGAGYIAALSVFYFLNQGWQVIVVDQKPLPDFEPIAQKIGTTFQRPGCGFSEATSCSLTSGKLVIYQADFANTELMSQICAQYQPKICLHAAASIEVGASVNDPQSYYHNNFVKTVTLIDTLMANGVTKIIFSSSAAVYGTPTEVPIPETLLCQPINPYGRTKVMVEQLLTDYAHAYGLQYVSLRYFNASGALPELGLGEQHDPETHLIPRALAAAALGTPFTICGNDYPTADGTCVRDYIHVLDIARAHYAAAQYLLDDQTPPTICNLGSGTGYSVSQVLATIERVTGKTIHRIIVPRRPGDPATLIADINYTKRILKWQPVASDLEQIVRDAWEFYTMISTSRLVQI